MKKVELRKKLRKMGIPVKAGMVKKSDIKKVLAAKNDNENTIAEKLLEAFKNNIAPDNATNIVIPLTLEGKTVKVAPSYLSYQHDGALHGDLLLADPAEGDTELVSFVLRPEITINEEIKEILEDY